MKPALAIIAALMLLASCGGRTSATSTHYPTPTTARVLLTKGFDLSGMGLSANYPASWQFDMLPVRNNRAYSGALLMRGWFKAPKVADGQFGPFHVRVPQEWFHEANVALLNSGLTRG